MTFPHPRRIRLAFPKLREAFLPTGKLMIIEMKTKRRWIVSVLEAVAEAPEGRVAARVSVRKNGERAMNMGQKGFAMRLKAATRPLADAAR
jgi:hypothetical protein